MADIVTELDIKEGIRKYNDEIFPAFSEEEQILALAGNRLSAYYEVYDSIKTREESARDFLVKEYGPKFAERVLADPNLRKRMRLDEPPVTTGTETAGTI